MKTLSIYIKEELDKAAINKIGIYKTNFKKKSLVAIKKAIEAYLKENDDSEEALTTWASNIWEEIGQFPKMEDFNKAVKDKSSKIPTVIDYYTRCNNQFGGKEVDKMQANDVIENICKGMNLNLAITSIAKKI